MLSLPRRSPWFSLRCVALGAAACCNIGLGAQTSIEATPMPFAAGPTWLGAIAAAYDSQRDVLVVLNWTSTARRETWEWDGQVWTQRDEQPTQLDRNLAYDASRGRTVLLCGDGATREWDGQTWTQTIPAGAGPALTGAAMAFDGQHIVVFGGNFAGIAINATLLYDGVHWWQATPTVVPPIRPNPQLCYDPARDVVVLVADDAPDVYEWHGSDWTIAGSTPWAGQIRRGSSLAFHANRGRVWVAGGSELVATPLGHLVPSPVLTTYEWDGASWTATAPLAAATFAAAGATLPSQDAALLGGLQTNPTVRALTSTNPAVFAVYGAGCAGGSGVPSLTSRPWQGAWTGQSAVVHVEGMPAATTFAVLAWALSDSVDAFGPLPRDLSAFGLTGCVQRTSSDVLALLLASAGTAEASLTVPANPVLAGVEVFAQALVPDPAANPFGASFSDAARLTVGTR